MVDPPSVVRRKPILVQMNSHDFLVLLLLLPHLLQDHKAIFRYLAALPNARFKKQSVLFIYSMLASP